jgi:hypothetical protein
MTLGLACVLQKILGDVPGEVLRAGGIEVMRVDTGSGAIKIRVK